MKESDDNNTMVTLSDEPTAVRIFTIRVYIGSNLSVNIVIFLLQTIRIRAARMSTLQNTRVMIPNTGGRLQKQMAGTILFYH